MKLSEWKSYTRAHSCCIYLWVFSRKKEEKSNRVSVWWRGRVTFIARLLSQELEGLRLLREVQVKAAELFFLAPSTPAPSLSRSVSCIGAL